MIKSGLNAYIQKAFAAVALLTQVSFMNLENAVLVEHKFSQRHLQRK